MEVKIEGDKLIITLPISEHSSKTGKTTVIASTSGNKPTTATYKGKVVVVGANAYISKD
jgi:hypothetical protein